MARHKRRHRRHHRRGYRGYVQLPSMGDLGGILDWDLDTKDTLMGALGGFAGAALLKVVVGKAGIALPDVVQSYWPVVGSGVSGAGLYAWKKKSSKKSAESYFVGALLAGAAVSAWDALKNNATTGPYFQDVVALRYGKYGRYGRYGVLVDEPTATVGPGGFAMNGLIVNDPSHVSMGNLAQLAAYSTMGDSDTADTIEDLMSDG